MVEKVWMGCEISIMTTGITTSRLPAVVDDMSQSLAIGAKRTVTLGR